MRRLATLVAVLLLAVVSTASLSAQASQSDDDEDEATTVKLRGTETLKPNVRFFSNFRFKPGSIQVKSGDSVTWKNKTEFPHTITVVADAPDDPFELFFCREPGGPCRVATDGHFTTPPTFVLNVGAAGLDQPGDSLLILDPGASVSAVVSAPSGTPLEYICAFHPWMQGSISVQ
jgi:plastocyanin